jgi:hypothetical protein
MRPSTGGAKEPHKTMFGTAFLRTLFGTTTPETLAVIGAYLFAALSKSIVLCPQAASTLMLLPYRRIA